MKDTFYAKWALILSLGFWIPLFNIGFSITSIYLALKSLRLTDKQPKKYGGRKMAVIALVLSTATFIGTTAFSLIYMYRRLTCETIALI